MADNDNDMSSVARSIGQLSGQLQVMHQSITENINVIRQDLRRMEDSTKESMLHLEDRINKKVDSISTRVVALEAEDKKMIEKTAKLSAYGGGVGGVLAAAAVELIKRLG